MKRSYCLDEKNRLILSVFCGYEEADGFRKRVEYFVQTKKEPYPYLSTFFLLPSDIVCSDDEEEGMIGFVIGKLDDQDGFVHLDKRVFQLDYEFAFHPSINLVHRYFAYYFSPVVKTISEAIGGDAYVVPDESWDGEDRKIPLSAFDVVCSRLPTSWEIKKYRNAAVYEVVNDYFDSMPNRQEQYESYIFRRRNKEPYKEHLPEDIYHQRLRYYRMAEAKIREMLQNSHLHENDWQVVMGDLLLILFPQYVLALPKVRFSSLGCEKEVDFLMVDNAGRIDVFEIKKPSIGPLYRESTYRGNYIPTRELSGTLVQVEKYLHLFQSSKKAVEKDLSSKFQKELDGVSLNIVHPRGFIIAGRRGQISQAEESDFPLIRTMHKDIIDIMTYDDLLERIGNSIASIERKLSIVDGTQE